jgi:hypothetical protein
LIVAAELSGDRPVASGAISPARAEQRRLGEMIDAFPSRPAAEIASPDRGMVPHLTELGLSIRLFAE